MLQTNKAENEVLKFEYQHEIFFGPARYPKVKQGPGVDWGGIPLVERGRLCNKIKINPATKTISDFTQLAKSDPQDGMTGEENNYKVESAEYKNTYTHPELKTKGPGLLVPIGPEIPEERVMLLAFDTLDDEQLGISLIQFLQLTIQYVLNMERAGAQTMVNFGFNKWIANTPFKNKDKMNTFAKSLTKINSDSVRTCLNSFF